MPVSADTLLRYIRHAPEPDRPSPPVLGVDEWAWRKGHRYGTILVDLEQHRVVDLLPDRSAASFASWLHTHPGTEVITRDRGGEYADGARQRAPMAVKVADRFHLLENLADAVEKVLQRHTALVQRIPRSGTAERAPPPRQDREAARARTQQKTAQCYATIQALKATGMSQRAIARALGFHRDTLRRYVEADTVPERPRRASRPGIPTPYEGYVRERWRQGEQNGMALWQELVALGYPGKRANVARFVTKPRQDLDAGQAGLSTEWSQGQVEGQITTLKLIRRQMYGRGNFDLVRKRVLGAA